MLYFIDSDTELIKSAYKKFLFNLNNYLHQYNVQDELEYIKIVFKMLHNGFFSINGTAENNIAYNYLELPIELSQGVQVMWGIFCCRHATEFLYDLLCNLNSKASLIYIWIDSNNGNWHLVNPAYEKANHLAILFNDIQKYIIDPANKFIFQVLDDGQLKQLNSEFFDNIIPYHDENISTIGKNLSKYYLCRELGIKRLY